MFLSIFLQHDTIAAEVVIALQILLFNRAATPILATLLTAIPKSHILDPIKFKPTSISCSSYCLILKVFVSLLWCFAHAIIRSPTWLLPWTQF